MLATLLLNARFALGLFVAMHALSGNAWAACTNKAISFTPEINITHASNVAAGTTVWSGRLTATLTNCTAPVGDASSTYIDIRVPGVPYWQSFDQLGGNYHIRIPGEPTVIVTPAPGGTCYSTRVANGSSLRYVATGGAAGLACSQFKVVVDNVLIRVSTLPGQAGALTSLTTSGVPLFSVSDTTGTLPYVPNGAVVISAVTCTVRTNPTYVKLAAVSPALVPYSHDAHISQFTLNFEGCQGNAGKHTYGTFNFTPDPLGAGFIKNIAGSGAATNVALDITQYWPVIGTVQAGSTKRLSMFTGSVSGWAGFNVGYRATGGIVTPGLVQGVVTYDLTYQ